MKLVIAVCLAVLTSAYAAEEIESQHNYMYFPDGDGNLHMIDLLAKGVDLTGYASGNPVLARNLDRITFQLYTINNPTNPDLLILNSVSSVRNSNFRSSRPTRFLTHGWRSSQRSNAVVQPLSAYLETADYNVIVIDWSSIAGSVYVSAAPSVSGVANRVAEMIDFLSENAGLDVRSTKLIGHSLGGHVVGLAARSAKGNIEAVIALDPALPLFERAGPGQRVDETDADHVQVIHTNGGRLGLMNSIGDTDFYPNGGQSQPGCGLDLFGACAHARAYYYFAESIRNPTGFRATGQFYAIEEPDRNAAVFMGGRRLSTNARGSFVLATAGQPPFALG